MDLGGFLGDFLRFRSKISSMFFARDISVDLLARDTRQSPSVREHSGFLRFSRIMVHVNSKTTCLLPFKSTINVPHIESVTLKPPIPEINDCAFAEELIKLKKQYRIYLRFKNTLARMLVKHD